ncbi:hypothetical protein [Paenisporosarcina sp. OV554]|uniref:hypothetical protein n=1 Tax=Paenisporosarcina sp. OV554 TaxID=2135694 RepID=UPI001E5ED3CE|nr:hypothetical protein [Paenisporosarcina sp. OV554]
MSILYVVIGNSIVVKYSEILTILDFREIKEETERDAWLQNSRTRVLTDRPRVKSLIVTPFLTYASPLSPQNIMKKINLNPGAIPF